MSITSIRAFLFGLWMVVISAPASLQVLCSRCGLRLAAVLLDGADYMPTVTERLDLPGNKKTLEVAVIMSSLGLHRQPSMLRAETALCAVLRFGGSRHRPGLRQPDVHVPYASAVVSLESPQGCQQPRRMDMLTCRVTLPIRRSWCLSSSRYRLPPQPGRKWGSPKRYTGRPSRSRCRR